MATAKGDGPKVVVHHHRAQELLVQYRALQGAMGAYDMAAMSGALQEAQVEATLAVSQALGYIHERLIDRR